MDSAKGISGSVAAWFAALLLLSWPLRGGAFAEALRISGTGGAVGGIARVAKAFHKEHPEVDVILKGPAGSTGGIRAAIAGKLDIGLSSRPLTPEERGMGGQEVPYARTAFVFGVQRDVPLDGVTVSGIAAIFRGELERWKDGTPVRLVLRHPSAADTADLERMSPELGAAYEHAYRRAGMIVARTAGECADRIEKTRGAFGTTTLSQVVSENRRIKMLPVQGVAPSVETVRSGSYPYTRTFRLVTGPSRSAAAAKFMRFLGTPRAMSILLESGHVELP